MKKGKFLKLKLFLELSLPKVEQLKDLNHFVLKKTVKDFISSNMTFQLTTLVNSPCSITLFIKNCI